MSKRLGLFLLLCLVLSVSSISVYADSIVVGRSDGYVSVVNPQTWAYEVQPVYGFGNVTSLAVQSGGFVVVGNAAGALYLRHALDGLAAYKSDGVGAGTPIVDLALQSDEDVMVGCNLTGGKVRFVDDYEAAVLQDAGGVTGTVTSVDVLPGDDIVVGNTSGTVFKLEGDFTGWGAITGLREGLVPIFIMLQRSQMVT